MKYVLITGISRSEGLGTALAKQYLNDGWGVIGCSRHIDGEHLKQLSSLYPGKLSLHSVDVTKVGDVSALADKLTADGVKLNVLISNATSADAAGNLPIDDGLDTENMLNSYNVNAVGFLRLVQHLLPICAENALISAITSEAGSSSYCHRDDYLDYGMAKAALTFACVTLQRRLGPKGYRVLAIHPGWVQTRPAPPKAHLSPAESAAAIIQTIANPPNYVPEGNKGVFVWYDGRDFGF